MRADETPTCTLEEIPAALKEGRVARFAARSPGVDALIRWTLEDWVRQAGDVTVQAHRVRSGIEAVLRGALDGLKPDDLVDFDRLHGGLNNEQLLEPAPTKLRTVFEAMHAHANVRIPASFALEAVRRDWLLLFLERLGGYAVVNARTIKALPPLDFPACRHLWLHTFHFIWIGLSSGTLHFDEFDNTLVQLRGRKRVLVFRPQDTDRIDGGHYITRFDAQNPLSEDARRRSPALRDAPYALVDLEPGDGITIPARAYHAAIAQTFDSLSVNSFLLPHLHGPHPHVGRVLSRAFWGELAVSQWLYRRTGYSLCRRGPYEFV